MRKKRVLFEVGRCGVDEDQPCSFLGELQGKLSNIESTDGVPHQNIGARYVGVVQKIVKLR
jgi:hypothetical protein